MARPTGQRGGNPALHGQNIERRRENDDWNFRFKLGGQFYRGPCYTKDKRKAEAFAKNIKDEKTIEVRKDRAAGLGPMTFGAACEAWWNDEGRKNVETGLKFRLDWLCDQIGANKELAELTPDDITAVKNARALCIRTAGKDAKGKQLSRPLTPAAVKATLVTLRTVINYAAKAKGVAVRGFDWPFWLKDKRRDDVEKIRVMSEVEQALIWPHLTEEVREVAEFNLGHPKRINELLELQWPQVDLRGETIRIRIKGNSTPISDPIGGDDIIRLQALKAKKHHPLAVFTYVSQRTRAYNGIEHVAGQRRPMTYQHFYEVWTEACRAVGITDLNPHCLRHTGATRYYWAHPEQLHIVSKMLNHADISTTIRYYAKHNPELVRDLKRTSQIKGRKTGVKSSGKSIGERG